MMKESRQLAALTSKAIQHHEDDGHGKHRCGHAVLVHWMSGFGTYACVMAGASAADHRDVCHLQASLVQAVQSFFY
jgi:hypothetical protein